MTNYAGPSRPDTRSSGDLFDPHRDADRYSAVARNTKDSELKKNLLTAAASLLMAAAAMAATFDGVSRGYATGKDCYLGSGCYTASTVTDCVLCCDKHCSGNLFNGCIDMCMGGSPEVEIKAVAYAAKAIATADQNEIPRLVALVEAGTRSSNERVRQFSIAIAGETPFVQQVQ